MTSSYLGSFPSWIILPAKVLEMGGVLLILDEVVTLLEIKPLLVLNLAQLILVPFIQSQDDKALNKHTKVVV